MDNKKKERNRVDKYRSIYKKKRRRFHGYKPEKVTTTTTHSESMHMQDGEEPDLSLNMGMLCAITKVIKPLLLQLVGPCIIT